VPVAREIGNEAHGIAITDGSAAIGVLGQLRAAGIGPPLQRRQRADVEIAGPNRRDDADRDPTDSRRHQAAPSARGL
jgi:hypothetical protein